MCLVCIFMSSAELFKKQEIPIVKDRHESNFGFFQSYGLL